MAKPTRVRFYDFTQGGSPSLTATSGSLITVFKALLINGYNNMIVNAITQTAGVATCTVSTGHQLKKHMVVRISGANQAGYNGDFRVTSIVDANKFQIAVDASTASPSIGAISCKVAPLDWEIVSETENIAAFRSKAVGANKTILRVDDTNPMWSAIHACDDLLDLSTPTRVWPCSQGFEQSVKAHYLFWKKAMDTTAGPLIWSLVGDSTFLYWMPGYYHTTQVGDYYESGVMQVFGQYDVIYGAWPYNCIIGGYEYISTSGGFPAGNNDWDGGYVAQCNSSNTEGLYAQRNNLATTTNCACSNYTTYANPNSIGKSVLMAPNPQNGGISWWDVNLLAKGPIPGITGKYPFLRAAGENLVTVYPSRTVLENVVAEEGARDYYLHKIASGYAGRGALGVVGFDLSQE